MRPPLITKPADDTPLVFDEAFDAGGVALASGPAAGESPDPAGKPRRFRPHAEGEQAVGACGRTAATCLQAGGDSEVARENMIRPERLCRICRRNRAGAAAVEFAIVAPLFFLFVFGIIEFGRMVMVQQVITNASREGARVAVLDGTTEPLVDTVVNDYLDGAGIDTAVSDVSVTAIRQDGTTTSLADSGFGDAINVTVRVPFDEVSWLPTPIFIRGVQLRAATIMRRETVQ